MAREVRSYSSLELQTATSAQAVRVAIRNGSLVRLMKGIYASAEHHQSFAVRAHAALRWAGPKGLLTGQAALFLWGVTGEPPHQIHVALPAGSGRSPCGWVRIVHQSAPMSSAEWMSMAIAQAEPALIHAFGHLPDRERSSIVFAGVRQGIISVPVLVNALQDTPRVKARAALEHIVASIKAGDESHLEIAGTDTVFTTPRLKQLLRQHLLTARGQRFRVDYYDAATRTAFELDGAAFHGNLEQRKGDIARDATLATQGIQTIRFGYVDVMDRPDWCRDIALEVLATRQGA